MFGWLAQPMSLAVSLNKKGRKSTLNLPQQLVLRYYQTIRVLLRWVYFSLRSGSRIAQIPAGQYLAKCIVLGDTLVNKFELPEIEAVLAHEFGHHVHHALTIGIIVQ